MRADGARHECREREREDGKLNCKCNGIQTVGSERNQENIKFQSILGFVFGFSCWKRASGSSKVDSAGNLLSKSASDYEIGHMGSQFISIWRIWISNYFIHD